MKPLKKIYSNPRTVALCDNKRAELRIYKNFAIIESPVERWRGNTGGLDWEKNRVHGNAFDALLKVLEINDTDVIDDNQIVCYAEEIINNVKQ